MNLNEYKLNMITRSIEMYKKHGVNIHEDLQKLEDERRQLLDILIKE